MKNYEKAETWPVNVVAPTERLILTYWNSINSNLRSHLAAFAEDSIHVLNNNAINWWNESDCTVIDMQCCDRFALDTL